MAYVLDKDRPGSVPAVADLGRRLIPSAGGLRKILGYAPGMPLMVLFLLLWEIAPRARLAQPDLLPAVQPTSSRRSARC